MRTDSDIERDVKEELRWSPEVDDLDIAVKVSRGVATLTGFVRHYSDRYEAELAAKRVAGVMAVANDIEVKLPAVDGLADPDIAHNALAAIKLQLPFAPPTVKVLVRQGQVTLEGQVPWDYQRQRIVSAVRALRGVVSVNNLITLAPRVAPGDIKHRIEDAFRRNAQIDANHISVRAEGDEVILSGKVSSWAERDMAQSTAWSAPGVTKVKNELTIGAAA